MPAPAEIIEIGLQTNENCVVIYPNLGDAELIRFQQDRENITFEIVQYYTENREIDVFRFDFRGVKRFYYKTPFIQNVIMDAIFGEMNEIRCRNPEALKEAIKRFDEGPYAKIDEEPGIFFWIEPCAENHLIVHADKLVVYRRDPTKEDRAWALMPTVIDGSEP